MELLAVEKLPNAAFAKSFESQSSVLLGFQFKS